MERKRIGKWVLSVLLWFWTGGVYFFGEVIWKTSQGRPETISWTMFALAIILAVPLERFGAELPWGMPLVGQACICAAAITALEFVTGLVLNVWLGQICPQFTLLWLVLSVVGIVILDWMRYAVEGGKKPHYT